MMIKQLLFGFIFSQMTLTSIFSQNISQTKNGILTVNIIDFENDKGTAVVMLYKDGEGFPKSPDKAFKAMTVRIADKKAVAIFGNLLPGEYAISIYHDENGNKKMDTNFFGIPKEGVGNSNNAKGHFGPPKYSDAKFNFNGEKQTFTIKIVYL